MNDILQEIVAHKRLEIERQKEAVKMRTLLHLSGDQLERPTVSMRAALEASSSGIIAEFKRKSPSKGWLHPDATVAEIIPSYEANGAAACSVLTDGKFFGGSLRDLQEARSLVKLPLLRKDFIIDDYQLYQARVMGADAVLLIAACLEEGQCLSLAKTAHSLGLEVLLEIHSVEETAYINSYIDMLGVNNRNLGTFHTDTANSLRLVSAMTAAMSEKNLFPLLVSESGLSSPEIVQQLRELGFRGFLIGETFMKEALPGTALSHLIKQLLC